MRRTYHRTVSTNSEPSRANWDDDQPRECDTCGKTLRITKDYAFFRRGPGVRKSFCLEHWAGVKDLLP